ncbi:uncharacterized protein BKA78DRAFT_317404 [Phyllosticta capitalensis]|uniref:uncharacterized protein n=1 Tax=Phyllosticta capitalensis TaxID=121624 RepID=UPI00312D3C37
MRCRHPSWAGHGTPDGRRLRGAGRGRHGPRLGRAVTVWSARRKNGGGVCGRSSGWSWLWCWTWSMCSLACPQAHIPHAASSCTVN